jgi:lambda family phage portal protein
MANSSNPIFGAARHFVDAARSLVGAAPSAAAHEHRPAFQAAYLSGGRDISLLTGWRPSLRSAQTDVAVAWDAATARSIDIAQNTGWVSCMIDQAVANTVGLGLRLRAMPENDLIGMSEDDAQTWRKLVEARFNLWAGNPLEVDVEGTRTLGQMQAAAFRHYFATGEVLAELVWRRRGVSATGTKVRLLSSTRLVNRTEPSERLFGGVRCDADGMPVSYVTWQHDPLMGRIELEVPARDSRGRPNVIHVFEGVPGQKRGITPLVPVLKVAKQFDQLSDATLMSSIIQTIFAASITSSMPTEDALRMMLTPQEQARMSAQGVPLVDAWFEAQSGWAEGHPIDVGMAGRIAPMMPGEDLKFHSPEQPTSNYREFALHLLREMARCLGLTYESATGDYTGATYSSVRQAVNEIFGITKGRRKYLLAPFMQPIYEAWLEEEIAAGNIPFPGGYENFLANRAAACRAEWAGDPKPVADDLKAAQAALIYRGMGVVSDQMIANDLGVDVEDVYAQRAREKALRDRYKLPDNADPASQIAQAQLDASREKSTVDEDP